MKFEMHMSLNYRGVAQLVAHVVWDHVAAGSSPVTPTNKRYCNINNIGVSPSGKAQDFDSGIRRFESYHPSQI